MGRLRFANAMNACRLPAAVLVTVLLLGPAVRGDDYPHLKMGNPSGATPDRGDKDNFLMKKEFFALSYNNAKGTPNWVSWRLRQADLGNAPRRPFHPDMDLPRGFKRVFPEDYNGSGFDRGHMCPHSDRSKDRASSAATFVMTNMVPQSPDNNQKAWNQLEIYLDNLVERERKVCYVVAGPQGKGGVGRNGSRTTTPDGKVTVPAKTWKVVMVLNKDVDSPEELTPETPVRLIAVIMPNDDHVGFDWGRFRTSVKQVEELTGYKFFDKVPAEVIGPLKKRRDDAPIPPAHGHRKAG